MQLIGILFRGLQRIAALSRKQALAQLGGNIAQQHSIALEVHIQIDIFQHCVQILDLHSAISNLQGAI